MYKIVVTVTVVGQTCIPMNFFYKHTCYTCATCYGTQVTEQREPLKREPRRRTDGRQQARTNRAAIRDCSITQFAQIDDDNVSALQQVTKGGGGLTLASQWKSQFDDSEETDNEWKGENLQSPEHKGTNMPVMVAQVTTFQISFTSVTNLVTSFFFFFFFFLLSSLTQR